MPQHAAYTASRGCEAVSAASMGCCDAAGTATMGCVTRVDFRFGSCPGEIYDIQKGIVAWHMTTTQITMRAGEARAS